MLLTSLTIARKPARLTASRLRRSERINRSEAMKENEVLALNIKKYSLFTVWYYFTPAPLHRKRLEVLRLSTLLAVRISIDFL